jgi:hypothetical protein
MRCDEFIALFENSDLRKFIIDTSKSRNKLPQVQEDFVQESWLALSCAPAGHSIEAYKDIAERAIKAGYWQERKSYLLCQTLSEHFSSALSMTRTYQEDD